MSVPILLAAAWAQVSPEALDLHRRAFVFDAHVHMANRQFHHGGDMGERVSTGQVDLPRLREGGLDALFFTIFVNEEYYPGRHETRHALRLIDTALRQIERNRATIGLALNAADIERLNREGRVAAVLDLEGGFDLDGDLAVLRNLHRLGLRSAQLPAHNWANNFADSCCAPQRLGGLTEHGRAVVREMNRLGMVINVAHASEKTLEQTLEVSKHPIVSTHDGLRTFNDIPRVLSESLARKIAAKGGVIGFHIGNEFHNRPMFDYRTSKAGRPFWDTSDVDRRASMPLAELDRISAPKFPMVGIAAPDNLLYTVDEWFKVVDRAIEVVGEDHVMLGTDFDGGPTLPKPMRDIRDVPMLTQAMLKRGYSEARIRKFLGGNLLRVFREVTSAASSTSAAR
ncbi:MAG: membrane dipeptidase [Acidobacteria bacterium]|nr:membrane dipeptidase [Acidobacteriota bacterium]